MSFELNVPKLATRKRSDEATATLASSSKILAEIDAEIGDGSGWTDYGYRWTPQRGGSLSCWRCSGSIDRARADGKLGLCAACQTWLTGSPDGAVPPPVTPAGYEQSPGYWAGQPDWGEVEE